MRQLSNQQVGRCKRRRGSIYIPVMASALIVSVIGLSAIIISRTQLRSSSKSNELDEAEILALSAIENAMSIVNINNDWRTKYANNVESNPVDLGNGTVSWKFEDPDGDLANNSLDTTYLYGIGRVGTATYVNKVRLEATGAGLTCLESALHSEGNLTLDKSTLVGDSIISSNRDVVATDSSIAPPVEAVGTISGTTYTGTQTPGVMRRQMPGSSMFDYYLSRGSWIPIGSLDLDGTVYKLRKTVLSPNRNPYNVADSSTQTNPEGIYVIDCRGNDLSILNCRIVGTLVILNPGTDTKVISSVNWEPAIRNFPALLVDGSIKIKHNYEPLDETSLNTNFNPASVPFPYYGGTSDSDKTDIYTSRIKGLVAVNGSLILNHQTRIHGVVLADRVTTKANSYMNFTHNPQHKTNPPPGFADDSEYKIAPGSWERVAY